MRKIALFALAALAPLTIATQALADDAAIATAADAPTSVEELVVTGGITYRNRTEDVAPVLSYDLEYFQKFEPLTAGDALKRVPSVAFLSDILEADGARLRGLDSAYTQILINGEKVPGSGVDRSFFVDRVPAELIERIEIVRSPSANRSGDAMAGALNIVLRDSVSLDGGYIRGGALLFNDGRVRETYGAVWGGEVGPGRLLAGFNVQGRRNPKEKASLRYSEPPASDANFENREDQTDLRDGTDYSFNASYSVPLAGGELDLDGFYILTDRVQDERSKEYDVRSGGSPAPKPAGTMLTDNHQVVDIEQETLTLSGRYEREMFGGKTIVKLGYATFTESDTDTEEEVDYDRARPRFTGDRILTDIDDKELSLKLAHKRDLGGETELEVGLQYQKKDRDTTIVETRNRFNLPAPIPPYANFTEVPGGVNTIEETRLDPYVMLSGKGDVFSWEAGLRYETTDVDITDETVAPADRQSSTDYGILLPSAHLRWNLTPEDRISASIARTVRRPGFNEMSPALLEAELGDNDYIGNPNLKPETAWGLDVGYERRIGRQGIFGVNLFYRDVKDLIEVYNTGDFSVAAQDAYDEAIDDGATPEQAAEELTSFLLSSRNSGDGKVWGIEFDLSTPLTFVGLENTGVFFNYSWLDSDIDDEFGSRRFNSQSDYVMNVGFIHDVPSWGASFGMTYRKQGDAYARLVGEEVTTSYDGDLEAFVEKRFGQNFVVRLTGSNLLDGSKDETFNKFTTIEDQTDRDYDEYELETEKAGPVFQLIARYAF